MDIAELNELPNQKSILDYRNWLVPGPYEVTRDMHERAASFMNHVVIPEVKREKERIAPFMDMADDLGKSEQFIANVERAIFLDILFQNFKLVNKMVLTKDPKGTVPFVIDSIMGPCVAFYHFTGEEVAEEEFMPTPNQPLNNVMDEYPLTGLERDSTALDVIRSYVAACGALAMFAEVPEEFAQVMSEDEREFLSKLRDEFNSQSKKQGDE